MIGEKLKEFRVKKKLSVSECARALSVSPSTYREWEYGRSIIGEPYVKIAELFEVSLTDLFSTERSEALNEIEMLESELERLLKSVKSIKKFL